MLADSGASVLVWAPELADSVAALDELPTVRHRIALEASSAGAIGLRGTAEPALDRHRSMFG